MSDAAGNSAAISSRDLFQYGFLAVPMAFAGLPLYIHAPDFYAANKGLSLGFIGAALIVIRAFDAIQDPVIGYLSDRYARYRRSVLIASAVMMCLSFGLLFNPPGEFPLSVWFVLSVVLASLAFSMMNINLNALGSLWTEDTHEKTRITNMREGLGLIGLLAGAALPSLLMLRMSDGHAFLIFSVILAALLLTATGLFLSWFKRNETDLARRTAHQGFRSYKTVLKSLGAGDMRFFYGIYIVSMLASSIPAILVIFFVRDLLGAEAWLGLFLCLYFLAGIAGMPLWNMLARRYSKLVSWLLSIVLAIGTFVWAFFLGEGDLVAYGFVCVFSGLALGAELTLPPSILSDLVDRHKAQTETSSHFAGLAFLLKLALALASGIVFIFLDISHFKPDEPNTAEALRALSLAYALIPCAIKAVAGFILFFWIKAESTGDDNATHHHHFSYGGHHGT